MTLREDKLAGRRISEQKMRDKGQATGQRRRRRLLELLGNKCVKCGFKDPRALQVDHIAGDGNKVRAQYRYYLEEMKTLLDNLEAGVPCPDYQLLCANCNMIKRQENREHGGGRPRQGD